MNWNNLFMSRILDRGFEYWLDGMTGHVSYDRNHYSAIVEGTQDYFVTITKDEEGVVKNMTCNCPYAFDGNNCKHMAAVLYALDSEHFSEDELSDMTVGENKDFKNCKTQKVNIEAIINSLTIEQLRNELLQITAKDPVIASKIVAEHPTATPAAASTKTNKNEAENWSDYIQAMDSRIQGIIYDHTNGGYFVDWRNCSKLVHALDNDVIVELHDIIRTSSGLSAALELSVDLYDTFASLQVDDSGGDSQLFIDSMLELWASIYQSADKSTQDAMFADMNSLYDHINPQDEYLAEKLFGFMLDHFDQAILHQKKLAMVDVELQELEEARKAEEEKNNGKQKRGIHLTRGFDIDSYHFSDLILQRLDLMDLLGFEQTKILEFRNKHRFFAKIRALEMQEAEEQGRINDLIALLIEGKELDKDQERLVREYSEKLISCYEQLDQSDLAFLEAKDYAYHIAPGDLGGFIKLKSYIKTGWKKERENLFKIAGSDSMLNKLYHEEKLYDRMLASLKKSVSKNGFYASSVLSEIARYQDVLRPKYDKELLALYEQVARTMARPASGRSGYQEIVNVLQKMLDFDGGKSLVRELRDEWRIAYKNRPTMQDELGRVFGRRF